MQKEREQQQRHDARCEQQQGLALLVKPDQRDGQRDGDGEALIAHHGAERGQNQAPCGDLSGAQAGDDAERARAGEQHLQGVLHADEGQSCEVADQDERKHGKQIARGVGGFLMIRPGRHGEADEDGRGEAGEQVEEQNDGRQREARERGQKKGPQDAGGG